RDLQNKLQVRFGSRIGAAEIPGSEQRQENQQHMTDVTHQADLCRFSGTGGFLIIVAPMKRSH
ncbi:MAG: hypothetical protein V3T19_04730, partial [Acidiferrobacterales bacterium]